MAFRGNQRSNQKRYWINEEIRGNYVLAISEDGEKLGKLPIQKALEMAQQEEKDLIQIGYNEAEKTPVVKIMEYGKFLYQQKKLEKEKKKWQKNKGLKEITFGYGIAQNDLQIKMNKAKEFLEDWYSVKILGRLRWREFVFKDKMKERLQNIEKELLPYGKSQGIKEERTWYLLYLTPKVKK